MAYTVKWSQSGAAPQAVMLLDDISVGDFVKETLDLPAVGFEVLVNGDVAASDDILEDGDVITLNPKKSSNG